MSKWFLENLRARVDIPPQFRSVEKGGPFAHCSDCGRDLNEPGTYYMIEKLLRGRETIYELAICQECREQIESRISVLSRQRIDAFFEEREESWGRRIQFLYAMPLPPDELLRHQIFDDEMNSVVIEPWIKYCAVDFAPIDESRERLLVGMCEAGELLLGPLPWAIGEGPLEQMQEQLSAETREELDRWRDEHMGPSPEFEELLRGPRIVF